MSISITRTYAKDNSSRTHTIYLLFLKLISLCIHSIKFSQAIKYVVVNLSGIIFAFVQYRKQYLINCHSFTVHHSFARMQS